VRTVVLLAEKLDWAETFASFAWHCPHVLVGDDGGDRYRGGGQAQPIQVEAAVTVEGPFLEKSPREAFAKGETSYS